MHRRGDTGEVWEAIFGRTLRTRQGSVYRFVWGLLGDPDRALVVTEQTFAAAWEARHNRDQAYLVEPGRIAPWMYRQAYRRAGAVRMTPLRVIEDISFEDLDPSEVQALNQRRSIPTPVDAASLARDALNYLPTREAGLVCLRAAGLTLDGLTVVLEKRTDDVEASYGDAMERLCAAYFRLAPGPQESWWDMGRGAASGAAHAVAVAVATQRAWCRVYARYVPLLGLGFMSDLRVRQDRDTRTHLDGCPRCALLRTTCTRVEAALHDLYARAPAQAYVLTVADMRRVRRSWATTPGPAALARPSPAPATGLPPAGAVPAAALPPADSDYWLNHYDDHAWHSESAYSPNVCDALRRAYATGQHVTDEEGERLASTRILTLLEPIRLKVMCPQQRLRLLYLLASAYEPIGVSGRSLVCYLRALKLAKRLNAWGACAVCAYRCGTLATDFRRGHRAQRYFDDAATAMDNLRSLGEPIYDWLEDAMRSRGLQQVAWAHPRAPGRGFDPAGTALNHSGAFARLPGWGRSVPDALGTVTGGS